MVSGLAGGLVFLGMRDGCKLPSSVQPNLVCARTTPTITFQVFFSLLGSPPCFFFCAFLLGPGRLHGAYMACSSLLELAAMGLDDVQVFPVSRGPERSACRARSVL